MDCLLQSPEFSDTSSGGYRRFLGSIFTYGGISFIVLQRILFLLLILPLLRMSVMCHYRNHPECIRFTSFRLQDPLTAHGSMNHPIKKHFKLRFTNNRKD